MKKMLISQSMLRDWFGSPSTSPICRQLFYEKYIAGVPFLPSESMKLGLAFEYKLLGACRGGVTYELPKLKNGVLSKIESDLDTVVAKARDLFMHLKMEMIDLQPEWTVDGLVGHPDFVGKCTLTDKAIFDIKYTGYSSTDRFSPWYDLERVDKTQAIHYVYINYLLTGEYLPFYFIIFFKDGGVRILDCKLTVTALNAHVAMIDQFRKDVGQLVPNMPIETDYNQCIKCPLFSECIVKSTIPTVMELVA